MNLPTIASDAAIWAQVLLIVIGGIVVLALLVAWITTYASTRQLVPPPAARGRFRQILVVGAIAFAVVFVAGGIAGAFQ